MLQPQPTAHFPDLSHYEPLVDFHAVKASGCPLVATKCSEGTSYLDKTYAGFAQRIRSVGMILAAYAFLDHAPAEPQMKFFLSVAHLQKGDLQPAVDAEALGLTKAETFAAMASLEARGCRPILYCSLAFFLNVLGAPTRWPLWLAAYRGTLPALPAGVTLFAWQHTDRAVFPGVAKPCDSSYLYVPLTDLPKYCI